MSDKDRKARMEEQIDENLRRVYAETATEEVPDRFLKLLEQLRKQPPGGAVPGKEDGS